VERDGDWVTVQLVGDGVGAVGLVGAAGGEGDLAGGDCQADRGVAGGHDRQPLDRLGQFVGVDDGPSPSFQ
jgi:hypothetical protein